jgi:hypothetical protein
MEEIVLWKGPDRVCAFKNVVFRSLYLLIVCFLPACHS